MFKKNTTIDYSLLTIVSIGKRSFKNMGRFIKKSGEAIARILRPADESLTMMSRIAKIVFRNKKQLILIIDDTLIKKVFSKQMCGSGGFFDMKIGRKITAYKLLVAALTDGKRTIPVHCSFIFDKESLLEPQESKNILVQNMIKAVKKCFSDKELTVSADGAFATKNILDWCIENKIAMEVRMHSNRTVHYKGEKKAIRDIKELCPKGRHMARTISAVWHGMQLSITAQRRINKHGEESIVFQAATYEAQPSRHVAIYKRRWNIEKLFRTIKQSLGLQECFSTKIDVQFNHVASVLLAYSFVQSEAQKQKLQNPECAIRSIKAQKLSFLQQRFSALTQIFGAVYA